MGNQHFRLESLPPHLRVQAERQLGVSNPSNVLSSPEDKSKTGHIVFPIPGSTPPEGYQETRRRRGGMYKANTQAGLGNAPQPPIVPSPDGFKSIAEMRAEKKASRKRKYLTPDMANGLVKSCVVSQDGNEVRFVLGCSPYMFPTAQEKKIAMIGNRPRLYKAPKVQKAEKTIMLAMAPYAHHFSEWKNCPIGVWIDFCYEYPSSTPKKDLVDYRYSLQKNDLDNSTKGLLDALTAAGFWDDDNKIAELHLRKFRVCTEPRIEIIIRKLPPLVREADLMGGLLCYQ